MITGLDHIGIVVDDLEAAVRTYTEALGFTFTHQEEVPGQGFSVAVVTMGDITLELMQATSPAGILQSFIEKRGPGVHHLSFSVDDINQQFADVLDKGLRIIDEKPRPGGEGSTVFFVHPKDTHGVLVEFSRKGQD